MCDEPTPRSFSIAERAYPPVDCPLAGAAVYQTNHPCRIWAFCWCLIVTGGLHQIAVVLCCFRDSVIVKSVLTMVSGFGDSELYVWGSNHNNLPRTRYFFGLSSVPLLDKHLTHPSDVSGVSPHLLSSTDLSRRLRLDSNHAFAIRPTQHLRHCAHDGQRLPISDLRRIDAKGRAVEYYTTIRTQRATKRSHSRVPASPEKQGEPVALRMDD